MTFQVIALAKKVQLRATSRNEMEEWMLAFKQAAKFKGGRVRTVVLKDNFYENSHSWYLKTNKNKICNVCHKPISNSKRSLACEGKVPRVIVSPVFVRRVVAFGTSQVSAT